jgi:hypothetical protein
MTISMEVKFLYLKNADAIAPHHSFNEATTQPTGGLRSHCRSPGPHIPNHPPPVTSNGLAAFAETSRADKGQTRKSEYWYNLTVKTYKAGNKGS